MSRSRIAALFAVFFAVMAATLGGLQYARRRLTRSAVRLIRPDTSLEGTAEFPFELGESGEDEQGDLTEYEDPFVTLGSLEEARAMDHTAVIMQGGGGAQIYLTVPVKYVQIDEATLEALLLEIDAVALGRPSQAAMSFELAPIGSGVFGGLGGGSIVDGVWIHPRLEADVLPIARAVVRGEMPLSDAHLDLERLRELRGHAQT